uniref:Ribosomal RNA-processing protein 40 n=1 Tax=Picocystis salinarum TaxID=88271 RepID=A0A7S3U982_9CHLO|mmetsp:Transcript_5313/g.33341  ORF Transcript_5313/g.33341 Transcript_5313/m.33341 type:complete len:242 (+) Transcript_5313:31-756(+)
MVQEALADETVDTVVLPGDVVFDLPDSGRVRLGGGLQVVGSSGNMRVTATKAGVLRRAPNAGRFWLEGSYGVYAANVGDFVVGIVEERHAEGYNVDIGSSRKATLSAFAFEGATRRNRPNIKIGDLVYCRVEEVDRDLEPCLTCIDRNGKASGFGLLPPGNLIGCSTGLARRLLHPEHAVVLEVLSSEGLQFECAVGLNGRIWISADSPKTTFLISNAILNSEYLSPTQVHAMVKQLIGTK